MRKKLLGFLFIGVIAYIGLGFINSSGSVAVSYINTKDSTVFIKSLPPLDFYRTNLKLTGAPHLKCVSGIVIDNKSNQILYDKQSDVRRPIASITKLLAAIVLAEMDFDLNQKVRITRWDAKTSASSHLRVGEEYFAKDLFYCALVCSDNRAIKALARSSGIPYPEFIRRMNQTAKKIGMDSTTVVDPSGIYNHNISTAKDCVKLLNYALKFPIIKSAVSTRLYEFRSLNQKRLVRVGNTNRLLRSKWHVAGGKTGYISASGYCLVMRMLDDAGADITTVVLGAPSNTRRFSETSKIAAWAFENLDRILADGGN
jgi:D-alanyl-D-alanine endopeptidase (penicillin-binding protein 7)